MTKEEFGREIDRLRDVFGDAKFSEERIKTLWEKLKFTEGKVFEKAITHLILESKFCPNFSEIKHAISIFSERIRDQRKEIETEIQRYCSWCGNSGFVHLIHKRDLYKEVMRCQCQYGMLVRGIQMFEPGNCAVSHEFEPYADKANKDKQEWVLSKPLDQREQEHAASLLRTMFKAFDNEF